MISDLRNFGSGWRAWTTLCGTTPAGKLTQRQVRGLARMGSSGHVADHALTIRGIAQADQIDRTGARG
jgi:hypothetical protein